MHSASSLTSAPTPARKYVLARDPVEILLVSSPLSSAQLGEKLRKHYVDELKFLPSVFNADDVVYQSTDVPRAQASARFLMNSLYPADTARPKDTHVNIFTRREPDEIIYPNWSSCPRLRQINTHIRHEQELLEKQDSLRDSLPLVFETAPVATPAEMSLPSNDGANNEKKRVEPQAKNSVLESVSRR